MDESTVKRTARSVNTRMACKMCRKQKVRCDYIETLGTRSCVRCLKLKHECVADNTPAPKREKPIAKGTDRRIEHLEEALLETQNTIRNMQPYQPTNKPQFTSLPSPPSAFPSLSYDNISFASDRSNSYTPTTPSSSSSLPLQTQNSFELLLSSGLLTIQQARSLYEHFMTVLLPACPHVCLENISFDQLRKEHPLKMHAIITSAVNTLAGYENMSLEEGLRAHLAERLFVALDTDVSVIECIFIFIMWASPSLNSSHISFALMLMNICHSLCVFNRSQDEISENSQIDRLYLNAYCGLGGTNAALRNAPMFPWSASLQKANDKILANPDDHVGYLLTLTALILRLEQDICLSFEFQEANLEPSIINSLVDMFSKQIEQLKGHISGKNPIVVFNYFTLEFVLYDHAVRFLPNDGETNAVAAELAINALHSNLDFFISCKDILNTLPSFIFYVSIRAVMALLKYSAIVTRPVNLRVDAETYLKKLQECLTTAPQTRSIVNALKTTKIIEDRICNKNEIPLQNEVAQLWSQDVTNPTTTQLKDEWASFLNTNEMPLPSDDFWADLGL